MHQPYKRPFVYYTGAFWPKSYNPLGAWVKYGTYPDEVKIVERGPQWVHIRCPDRELLLCRTTLVSGGSRPLDMNWDEFVPFSWGSTTSANILSMDRYMINYHQHVKQPKDKTSEVIACASLRDSPNIRHPECTVDDRKTILSDSGGFQLSTGKTEWVDPLDYANWATNNCDEGITLDIPIIGDSASGAFEEAFLDRAAAVQVANTSLLLENVPDSFHLFNVVHGMTEESSKRFRSIIEAPDDAPTHGLCIGGMYHGNPMLALSRLLYHITSTDFRSYDQYHILGISNLSVLTPIIRFAALMRARGSTFTISSDASTAVYSAGNRTMHMQRAHYKNAERLMLGQSQAVVQGHVQNPYRILPCGCPVCSTFKYTDILSHVKESIVAHTFILHNAGEIDRWAKQQTHYAETLDTKAFSELVAAQMGSKNNSVQLALRFVEAVADSGHTAALREFSPYMGGILSSKAVTDESGDGLFEEEEERNRIPLHERSWWADRLDTILSRYENYHATGVVPLMTTKKEDLKRQTKKVQMNSAVVRAGQRKALKTTKALVGKQGESSHAKPGQRKIAETI